MLRNSQHDYLIHAYGKLTCNYWRADQQKKEEKGILLVHELSLAKFKLVREMRQIANMIQTNYEGKWFPQWRIKTRFFRQRTKND